MYKPKSLATLCCQVSTKNSIHTQGENKDYKVKPNADDKLDICL